MSFIKKYHKYFSIIITSIYAKSTSFTLSYLLPYKEKISHWKKHQIEKHHRFSDGASCKLFNFNDSCRAPFIHNIKRNQRMMISSTVPFFRKVQSPFYPLLSTPFQKEPLVFCNQIEWLKGN